MTDPQSGQQQADDQEETGRNLPVNLDPLQGEKTQFKPGQSGNPAGRPKGSKSLSTQIQHMMNDPKFIERLSIGIKERTGIDPSLDPEFQGTPMMKAIITVALIEAMNPTNDAETRAKSRGWLSRFGYGTKVDITSDGERISETPKIISIINARPDDNAPPLEAEAS